MKKLFCLFLLVAYVLITFSGCASRSVAPPPPPSSSLNSPSSTNAPAAPYGTSTYNSQGTQGASAPLPSYSQTQGSPSGYPIAPLYYDFEDIPVPQEMDMVADESRVFQAGQTKSGVLVFKGRVEPGSLVDFYQAAMIKEKWQFKSGFRYNRSVLIFEKPPKHCVIIVYSKLFYTYLEIYVASSQARF